MTTPSTPGERIRAAREIKRLTTAQLAKRVTDLTGTACTARSVQGWEADAAVPGYHRTRGLAIALGVSADYLLGLPANPKRGRS